MIRRKQNGATLIELILVFAIAASIVVFGINQYLTFRFQLSERQIASNVDQLFQGMAHYYQANCRQHLDAAGNAATGQGALDPTVSDASGTKLIYPLSISADLLAPEFLVKSWQPLNLLVDNGATDQGYFAQFNRTQSGGQDPVMSVFACSGIGNPPSCSTAGSSGVASGGLPLDPTQTAPPNPSPNPALQTKVVVWRLQVAVKLLPTLTTTQWTQIKNDLNALCESSLSGSEVFSCDSSPSAGGYIVFERAASFISPNITSPLWLSGAYTKEFNQQYTNDGMAALSGVPNETKDPSGVANPWYNTQNYLCGE
ncbi:MAG: type II secretion system protein [Gammaproteobacteria bacterium]